MSGGGRATPESDGDYPRPGQRWVCGHLAAGRPCPVGPDPRGRCTAVQQSLCRPRRDGDRWRCARPTPFGGPCADGPLPDGRCCRPEPSHRPCRPRRSLRGRRGLLVRGLSVLALGVVLLLLDGRRHLDWVSPGALSSPHTAVAARTPEQCSACHSAPGDTAHGWLRLSFSAPIRSDSERCLACHFGGLDAELARADHSAPPGSLATLEGGEPDWRHRLAAVWGPPGRSSAGLACGRCHQEHRGREADITALDDLRCQACHTARIRAFAVDHPVLQAPAKPPSLGFDHVQHQAFWPDRRLACADCHELAEDGVKMLTAGYRNGCAGCHAQGQSDFHDYGLKRRPHTVLQPPDMELGADPPWPVASGVLVSPLMWLLLAGDDHVLPALEDLFDADDLGLESEPYEWYPDDEALKTEFARAFYRLLEELAAGDGAALTARLEAMTGAGAPVGPVVEQLLAGQFALQAFRARWYGTPTPDPGWSLAGEATGWLIDSDEIAVVYRPTGHGDALLRALIELLHGRDDPSLTGFRERLAAAPSRSMRWTQVDGRSPASGYDKFTHASHFDIRRGDDSCAGCHRPGEEGGPNRGFTDYRRDHCGQCHQRDMAPDGCLHCHNYHFVRP